MVDFTQDSVMESLDEEIILCGECNPANDETDIMSIDDDHEQCIEDQSEMSDDEDSNYSTTTNEEDELDDNS